MEKLENITYTNRKRRLLFDNLSMYPARGRNYGLFNNNVNRASLHSNKADSQPSAKVASGLNGSFLAESHEGVQQLSSY